jgi:hypothetical protein
MINIDNNSWLDFGDDFLEGDFSRRLVIVGAVAVHEGVVGRHHAEGEGLSSLVEGRLEPLSSCRVREPGHCVLLPEVGEDLGRDLAQVHLINAPGHSIEGKCLGEPWAINDRGEGQSPTHAEADNVDSLAPQGQQVEPGCVNILDGPREVEPPHLVLGVLPGVCGLAAVDVGDHCDQPLLAELVGSQRDRVVQPPPLLDHHDPHLPLLALRGQVPRAVCPPLHLVGDVSLAVQVKVLLAVLHQSYL